MFSDTSFLPERPIAPRVDRSAGDVGLIDPKLRPNAGTGIRLLRAASPGKIELTFSSFYSSSEVDRDFLIDPSPFPFQPAVVQIVSHPVMVTSPLVQHFFFFSSS